MTKAARIALILLSLVVFVGIPSLTGLRIWGAHSTGRRTVERHFSRLTDSVSDALHSIDEADYEQFADQISASIHASDRLVAVIVVRAEGHTDYAWSRSRERLPRDLSRIGADLHLERNAPWESQKNSELRTASGQRVQIAALYETLDITVVYTTLRDGLLVILAFALLVLIALIATLRPSDDHFESRSAARSGKSSSSVDKAPLDPIGPPDAATGSSARSASPQNGQPPSTRPDASDRHNESKAAPPLVAPESGLSFADHLPRRLALELERVAENELDLSVLLIRITDTEGCTVNAQLLGTLVLEQFPFEDLAFEYSDMRACVILTGIDLDAAIRKAERFMTLLRRHELGSYRVRIGLSSRNGRLVEGERMLHEATQAFQRCDEGSPITGFRPDPERYRSYISTRS